MEPDDVGQAGDEKTQRSVADLTRKHIIEFIQGGGNQGAGARVSLDRRSQHWNGDEKNRKTARKARKVAAHSRKVNNGSKVHRKQVRRKKAKASRG